MSKPEITTAEELAALPVGAVVLDADGDAWQKKSSRAWWCTDPGIEEAFSHQELADNYGPYKVLHEGDK